MPTLRSSKAGFADGCYVFSWSRFEPSLGQRTCILLKNSRQEPLPNKPYLLPGWRGKPLAGHVCRLDVWGMLSGSEKCLVIFSKGSLKQSLILGLETRLHHGVWLWDNEMGYLIKISESLQPNKYPLPSEQSSQHARYLSQGCCHCFRYFGDSLENCLQTHATLFGISTMVAGPHPVRLDFIFGNSQKAFWHM